MIKNRLDIKTSSTKPLSYVSSMQIPLKSEAERIRLSDIDFLRSLAIVLMIYANSFPYAADFNPPGILRLLMSLAAPLFIFLSGFTSTLNHSRRISNIISAGALFLSAIFVDIVIWGIVPLYTFDVLYCIATTLFINSILSYTHKRQIALIISTLSIYIFLHYNLPYNNEIQELTLDKVDLITLPIALKQAIITGWFPLFPWMAFGFLGRLYGMNLEKFDTILLKLRPFVLICLPIAVLLDYNDSLRPSRMEYIEVFYPPSPLYLLLAFIWIVFLLCLKNKLTHLKPHNFILTIGKSSLLIYILHATINNYFFQKFSINLNFFEYSMLIVLLLLFFHFIASFHQHFKKNKLYSKCPILILKIFGI